MNYSETQLDCENHFAMSAVGVCEVCGKPVCGDCATSHEGKTFCDETSHIKIYDEYNLFGEGETIFEVELVARNLQANNISCAWFNPKQYGIKLHPRLFVAKQSLHSAETILQSLELMDFITVNNDR